MTDNVAKLEKPKAPALTHNEAVMTLTFLNRITLQPQEIQAYMQVTEAIGKFMDKKND